MTSRITVTTSAVAAVSIRTLAVIIFASGWESSRHYLPTVGSLVATALPFLAAVVAAIVPPIVSPAIVSSTAPLWKLLNFVFPVFGAPLRRPCLFFLLMILIFLSCS